MSSPASDDTLTRALAETVAMRAIAEILSELPDNESRARVVRWCAEHYATAASHVPDHHDGHSNGGGKPVHEADHALSIDPDVFEMLPPKPEPIHCDATELEEFLEPDEYGPIQCEPGDLDDLLDEDEPAAQKPRPPVGLSLGLDSLLRDFVCDFQRLALEFQRA